MIRGLITGTLVLVLLGVGCYVSYARDTTGLSAQLTEDQKAWVRDLTSTKGGYCCADADGIDPVWRVSRESPTGYQVLLDDEWQNVEPGYLVTVPNLIGVARVWVRWLQGKKLVRCFLPGPTGQINNGHSLG